MKQKNSQDKKGGGLNNAKFNDIGDMDSIVFETSDEEEIRNICSSLNVDSSGVLRIQVYGDGMLYFDTKENIRNDHNNRLLLNRGWGDEDEEKAKAEIESLIEGDQ